jgi:hypothetical protein
MKVRLVFFLLGVYVLLGYSSKGLFLTAQAQPTAPALPHSSLATANLNSRVYHIELSTLRDCLHGDCLSRFTERNFAVSQNGLQYPVRVTSPSRANAAGAAGLPTHLLVVLPSGARRLNDADLVKSLNRVFSEGWLVSVNRPDGSFTPYSTADALSAALAAAPAAPLTASQVDQAAKSEIETLGSFPGRRLLLLDVTGPRDKPALQWTSLARKTRAQAYIVDGGVVEKKYVEVFEGTLQHPDLAEGYYKDVKMRAYDGVFHEVKLAAAVKDALADASYDYDLQFEIPESQSGPASPITLTLVKAQGLLPYQQNVEFYTVAEQAANGGSITVRTTPPQKLQVEGWWK